MTSSALMNLVVMIVVAVIGWLLKAGCDSWVNKIDGKVDKSCHEQCSKAKERMENLLLGEIQGLRTDFKEKSDIVINAVEKE